MQTKRILLNLGAQILLAGTAMASTQNGTAHPASTIISGNARFTVLTPRMIRIEYSDSGKFEDRPTFAVLNREFDGTPAFRVKENEEYLEIDTDSLLLKYRKGTSIKSNVKSKDLSVTMTLAGQPVTWHPGMEDNLNLKGTCRTLDGSNGDNKRAELEQGIISRSGWAVIDDSPSTLRADGSRSFAFVNDSTLGYDWWSERNDKNATDLYFMGYGHDYRGALKDFTKLSGKIPLPPKYVFGYWYSKYASYSADDYRMIMESLEKNDIPADVIILDMDWHWNGDAGCNSEGRGGWTGWSWNTSLIPDPEKLLDDIHKKGYRLSLNLHPADGVDSVESPRYYADITKDLNGRYNKDARIPWNIDYPDFTKSFFNRIIRDHEKEGVDFWWLDWQQHLTSDNTPGLGETFWNNHVFFNDMKHNRPDRRPVIFHRWGGLGCHRYQIGFSGDALINFPTLAFQPYFTSTASNVGYAYWGHDLGGHAFTDVETVNDPELVLRWIQFGVFTPIFRTHATKDDRIERRIWKFDNFPSMREAVRLRYSLFPYIYTMARKTYDTGIGLCRPLYYDYPESDAAYAHEDEYMFGDNILVAPIVEPSREGVSARTIWFPEGKWWDASRSAVVEGSGEKKLEYTVEQIPYFFKAGPVIPFYPGTVRHVTDQPSQIILNAVAGASGSSEFYEDQGDNADYEEKYAVTRFEHISDEAKGHETFVIQPREGDDSGLPAQRAWELNVFDIDKPNYLKLDGKKLSDKSWKYDAGSRTLVVTMDTAPCSKSRRVEIFHP